MYDPCDNYYININLNMKLKTIREETPANVQDPEFTLCTLLIIDKDTEKYIEDLPYLINNKSNVHIFFHTYFELLDYITGERDMVKAYMEEEEFDDLYAGVIPLKEKSFTDYLMWVK